MIIQVVGNENHIRKEGIPCDSPGINIEKWWTLNPKASMSQPLDMVNHVMFPAIRRCKKVVNDEPVLLYHSPLPLATAGRRLED